MPHLIEWNKVDGQEYINLQEAWQQRHVKQWFNYLRHITYNIEESSTNLKSMDNRAMNIPSFLENYPKGSHKGSFLLSEFPSNPKLPLDENILRNLRCLG